MDFPVVFGCIDALELELACGVCQKVPDEIHTIACDHSFCLTCITDTLASGQNECPVCRMPSWNTDVRKNLTLTNFRQALVSLRTGITNDVMNAESEEEEDDDDDDDESEIDFANLSPESLRKLGENLNSELNAIESALSKKSAAASSDFTPPPKRAGNAKSSSSSGKRAAVALGTDERPTVQSRGKPGGVSLMPMDIREMQHRFMLQNLAAQSGERTTERSLNQSPVLLPSSLDDDLLKSIKKTVKELRGTLSKTFGRGVTHLLTKSDGEGRVTRTIKYAQSVLSGIWIVSPQWVEDSLTAGYWLDESGYEVKGDRKFLGGPTKGRARVLSKKPALFSGISIHFYGEQTPMDADNCTLLVKIGGGKVVDIKHFKSFQDSLKILVDGTKVSKGELKKLSAIGSVYQSGWLLDCISNHEVLPRQGYEVPAEK